MTGPSVSEHIRRVRLGRPSARVRVKKLSALLITLLAFGSTILCVAVLKRFAPGLGLLDQPDERKKHEGAIPLVGGISIWLAFSICMLFYGITMLKWRP